MGYAHGRSKTAEHWTAGPTPDTPPAWVKDWGNALADQIDAAALKAAIRDSEESGHKMPPDHRTDTTCQCAPELIP